MPISVRLSVRTCAWFIYRKYFNTHYLNVKPCARRERNVFERPTTLYIRTFSSLVLSKMKTACFRTASVALQGKKKAGNCRGEGEKVAGGARTTKA